MGFKYFDGMGQSFTIEIHNSSTDSNHFHVYDHNC